MVYHIKNESGEWWYGEEAAEGARKLAGKGAREEFRLLGRPVAAGIILRGMLWFAARQI